MWILLHKSWRDNASSLILSSFLSLLNSLSWLTKYTYCFTFENYQWSHTWKSVPYIKVVKWDSWSHVLNFNSLTKVTLSIPYLNEYNRCCILFPNGETTNVDVETCCKGIVVIVFLHLDFVVDNFRLFWLLELIIYHVMEEASKNFSLISGHSQLLDSHILLKFVW